MTVGAVVPAAGRGSRFGSAENKVWAEVLGKPVLAWTLDALHRHPRIERLIVVSSDADRSRMEALVATFPKVSGVAEGGATRTESVWNGVQRLPEDCDLVLVHDAARPMVSQRLVSSVIEEAERSGAAIPGLPIVDTVKRTGPDGSVTETITRAGLWTVQTPQAARRDWLEDAYAQFLTSGGNATDEASLLEAAGRPVRLVAGEIRNAKLTTPEDLERLAGCLAESVAGAHARHETRTGIGYDVHRFCENRPLWLGCVRIPHGRGLLGHSDADVLAHAVCDALLGAGGLGDIGRLFPDTDIANKDRPSSDFLTHAAERLAEREWGIAHIDATVLAEEPKIGPCVEAMRAATAKALGIQPEAINIKATTSEGMGFIGRSEGIACWAVATIRR